MVFGYVRNVRVRVDEQVDLLKSAGCDKIEIEDADVGRKSFPVLNKLLKVIRKGDVIVISHLQSLNYNSNELVSFINSLSVRGIDFKCLTNEIFDTTVSDSTISIICSSLKDLDKVVSGYRKLGGIERGRQRGLNGGRKRGSYNKDKAALAVALYQKNYPILKIMEVAQIRSKETLYNYLRWEGAYK